MEQARAVTPDVPPSDDDAVPGAETNALATKKDSAAWLAARTEKAKEALEKSKRPSQLPLWPDAVRVVPNAILRGALFSISNVRDVMKKRTLLASSKGFEVRFKGERLNQTDLDVWETLIHLARSVPLGDKVYFSAHSMLTLLGRHHGREQHEQLKEDIARLTGAVVEIAFKEKNWSFGGTMVRNYARDEEQNAYFIEMSPSLLNLYETGSTYIDWAERQLLGNAYLAKWLHGFYSTHADPMPYKVETIQHLCGAKPTQRLTDFRKSLRNALDLLVEKAPSIISAEIDANDCVQVTRRPSKSQRRHLDNRAH